MASNLGPHGPLLVAGFVIVYLAIRWPLTADLGGISMNLVAMVIVAAGGLWGAVSG